MSDTVKKLYGIIYDLDKVCAVSDIHTGEQIIYMCGGSIKANVPCREYIDFVNAWLAHIANKSK